MTVNPLESKAWQGLAELFRPPPGYTVDRIFGTTFSLSFDALMAVLLATQGAQEVPNSPDDAARLIATTRMAGRVRVLVQDGGISGDLLGIPADVLALMEQSVVSVKQVAGSFHPKIWVLSFVPERPATSETAASQTVVRVLIASRNLSLSSCLEFGVVFEGVAERREDALAKELLRIVQRCGELAPADTMSALGTLPEQLRRTRFHRSAEAEEHLDVTLQDADGTSIVSRLPEHCRRMIVVSPFITSTAWLEMRRRTDHLTVISTPAALSALGNKRPDLISADTTSLEIYAVRDDVPPAPAEEEAVDELEADFKGLHAKVILIEHGNGTTESLVGSANATVRGLGLSRPFNTECMVSMRPGINMVRFRSDFIVEKTGAYRPWIRPFTGSDIKPATEESDIRDRLVEQARLCATVPLTLSYDGELRTLQLTADAKDAPLVFEDGATVECVPVGLLDGKSPEERALAWRSLDAIVAGGVTYSQVPLGVVSAFVAVRVSHQSGMSATRIGQAALRFTGGTSKEARDKAAEDSLQDRVDPAALLAKLVNGIGTHAGNRPVEDAIARRRRRSTSQLLEHVSLEQMLQAVVRTPSLIGDLKVLLRDRCDDDFMQLLDDLQAVEASYV